MGVHHTCHEAVDAGKLVFGLFTMAGAVLVVAGHVSARAHCAIAKVCLAGHSRMSPSHALSALGGRILIAPW